MPAQKHRLRAVTGTPAEPTFDDDVRRLVAIQDTLAGLNAEADAIKERIRAHGPGKVGDLVVKVTTQRRWSAVRAAELLNPEQILAIAETTLSSAKAKQLLPPAIYEACMYEYGAARVAVY